MEKSILIVGGGIAGLATGCYAQMNGFRTTIIEMHSIPGGLCTAWKRKGYKFDISMHMVTGSVSGPFNKMWKELGVIENFQFHYHDHYLRIEGREKSITFCNDRKKLEEQMLAISNEDEKLIREFTGLLFGRDMLDAASLKPAELKNPWDSLKTIPLVLPLMKVFLKYKNKSLQEFAERFSDPFLKKAIRYFLDGPGWAMPDYPMITLTGFINSGLNKSGVPLGGSQQVAFRISDLYKELGGDLKLNLKVTDLIVNENKVKGVILADGSEYHADCVVWAGDGHTLIFDILKGRYISDPLRNMYANWVPVKPVLHVMMGVNRDFSGEPHKLLFELEKSETIAGKEIRWLSFLHHCFDPSMAPPGKSSVEVWFDTDYDYWENLSTDREKYDSEKRRISEFTIAHLAKRFPGFDSQVEVVDVPTPVTYKRYTGNWKASPDGWAITNSNLFSMEPVRTLPGLEGLYMAGQWTAPYTGTVIAALSGRQIIEIMCCKEGRKFVSEK
jgi:phytoene dehydrogenase-like protein